MSRLAYYADFITMPLLILLLLAVGGDRLWGVGIGVCVWSLAEYVIHRLLFHRLPVFKAGHDEHHAHPSGRTGVTSWHSLAVFGVLAVFVPPSILAGIALGYLAYITAHHAVHHWRVAPTVSFWGITLTNPLYGLKLRHALHHAGVEVNFGVVTTLWDRIFGTHQSRTARKEKRDAA